MKNLFTRACFLPFVLGLLFSTTGFAQLTAGDIAIIASNHDGGDDIAFVALTDIPANQVIYFTDNEWDGSAFNDLNEGEITWTNDNSILSAGSVVVFTDISGSYSANVGSLAGSSFNLGASDEWFYVLTSAPATSYGTAPTFLAAFSNDAGSGWLTNTGLVEGTTAIDFNNDRDGFKYTGSIAGEASFSDYLTLIYSTSNWQQESSNGENILPISTTDFTITGSSPTVGFDAASSFETETNTTFTSANIPISVTNYNGNQIDVDVAITGGTAEPADYVYTTQSLSFTSNSTQNITVDINDDADTDDETIIFTITETSSVTGLVISQATHTLTITDDEVPPSGLQVTTANTAYTIDFDNTVVGVNIGQFDGSGLASSPGTGQLDADAWQVTGLSDNSSHTFGTDQTSGDFAVGTSSGGTSSGGLYAFDVGGSNHAIGVQPTSDDYTPGAITLLAQNATGSPISTIRVSYTVYVYNDQGRASSWNFGYSTDNNSYTSVSDLDFTSTEAAAGTPAWKSHRHVTEFSLTVADGGNIYLKWTSDDVSGSGSRDEIAIDDIEVIGDPTGNISLNGLSYDGYNIYNATSEITSGTFSVTGDITNNGTINVADGASLLQTTTTDNNSGTGTYNITRNTGILSDDTWYQYWSSPVSGETMGDAFPGANTSDFYSFDGSWAMEGSGTVMQPGVGYITTGTIGISNSAENRTFAGDANNGSILVNSGVASAGYTLVGNPYPSAISATDFLAVNDDVNGSGAVEPTVWLWNQATNQSAGMNDDGDYATINHLGAVTGGNAGVMPNGHIASCQGFFVQAASASPGISFTNSMRVVGNNSQFFKQGNTENRQRIWLNLSNDRNQSNQILIGFVEGASVDYDGMYDGDKLKGNSGLAFYSLTGIRELAIQGLPYMSVDETSRIPLGVDAWITGEYTIALDSLDKWPQSYTAWVEDKEADTLVALVDLPYTFTVDTVGSIKNRFALVVKHELNEAGGGQGLENPEEPGTTTGMTDSQETFFKAYVQQGDLVLSAGYEIERFTLYDFTGRIVLEQEINTNAYRTSVQLNGVYLLRVTSKEGNVHTTKLNF